MLAELAAANAAFSVLKQCVSNGKELVAAGNAIADFVGAKETLQRKVNKKGGGSDLAEFMALEELKAREEELKTLMIYAGRPGLWNDWQKFQAKARIARREAEEKRKRKIKQYIEITIISFFFIVGLGVLASFILLALHVQGRL
jgi:hypothetical protein